MMIAGIDFTFITKSEQKTHSSSIIRATTKRLKNLPYPTNVQWEIFYTRHKYMKARGLKDE
jgi:hypothetical protein